MKRFGMCVFCAVGSLGQGRGMSLVYLYLYVMVARNLCGRPVDTHVLRAAHGGVAAGCSAFRYGLTYLVSVLAPIPNIGFWAVHPTRQFADLAHWLQDAMHMRYGPGYTIVAESYINFGWFGIAAMVVIGVIMARSIARISNKNAENNVLGMTFQIMIIMTIMKSLVRSSFSAAVRDIAYVLIPLYLLIRYSTRKEVSARL